MDRQYKQPQNEQKTSTDGNFPKKVATGTQI